MGRRSNVFRNKYRIRVGTREPSLGDYVFQTILHEIGHALGIDHLGNYNSSANYYDMIS